MQDKKYYEIEYTDLIPGVTFKFAKLNPIEHLNIVTLQQSWDVNKNGGYTGLLEKILINVLWTKDNKNWIPLIDSEGNAKLPEYETCPSLGLDLFIRFKNEVIEPVFTESKTFQNIMNRRKQKETTK